VCCVMQSCTKQALLSSLVCAADGFRGYRGCKVEEAPSDCATSGSVSDSDKERGASKCFWGLRWPIPVLTPDLQNATAFAFAHPRWWVFACALVSAYLPTPISVFQAMLASRPAIGAFDRAGAGTATVVHDIFPGRSRGPDIPQQYGVQQGFSWRAQNSVDLPAQRKLRPPHHRLRASHSRLSWDMTTQCGK